VNKHASNFQRFLAQPYPFYYFPDRIWQLFVALFLFSFLFLYWFEPFVVNRQEHRMDYFWICLIHAGQPTLLTLLYFWILQKLTRDYALWTLGKEFLHVSVLLLLIGIASFLVRDIIYNNPYNWSWRYFFEEVRNTFLVGFLILAIFVPLNYVRLLRQYVREAEKLSQIKAMETPLEPTAIISIKTQLQSDDFSLDPNSLVFARADGNYMEIYVQKNGGVEKLIKRMTLTELEGQLASVPFILKTHRAYLVNLNKVRATKGNAQGYQLKLEDAEEAIPVSRSLLGAYKSKMLNV
jgi:hypothetical protein